MPKIADALRAELQHESKATRSLFAVLPEDKLDWRPHEKSMALGRLAAHIAEIPGRVSSVLEPELDFAALDYQSWVPRDRKHLLDTFDKAVAASRKHLDGVSDEDLHVIWTMRSGDKILAQMPRVVALRGFVLNHGVHHRGQLTVYLRLLDVPLPSVYGPTADNPNF